MREPGRQQTYPRLWRSMCVSIFLISMSILACFGTARQGLKQNLEPIMATSPHVQKSYEHAHALLEQGKWRESQEAFELIQSEHPDDSIAPVAELFVARARLGDVRQNKSGLLETSASAQDRELATQLLMHLQKDKSVDARVRYSAMIYLAFVYSVDQKSKEALEMLGRYPGASMSGLVLPRDRVTAWMLLTESFWRALRSAQAFEAASMLYGDVMQSVGQGVEAVDPVHEAALDFALSRGMEAAGSLDTLRLNLEYVEHKQIFLRAISGWVVLHRLIDEGVRAKNRAVLESMYTQTASALVEVGALPAASELSVLMASSGDTRRLMVGLVVPMSGKNRAVGKNAMSGALLASGAFDRKSKAHLTLIMLDSEGDAMQQMQRFKNFGVLAVVGPMDKAHAVTYGAAAKFFEIPLLTLSAQRLTPPAKAQKEPGFVFRNFLSAEAEAMAAAQMAFATLGDRRVMIVEPRMGYGKLMGDTFEQHFHMLGGQIVSRKSYDRQDTDYSKLARLVATVKPDAVFIPDTGTKVAQLTSFFARENVWGLPFRQTRSVRSKRVLVHYLGTSLWQDSELLRQGASYIQGAYLPVWFVPAASDPKTQLFTSRYSTVFGVQPKGWSAFSYDAVCWMRELLLDLGLRRSESVRKALVRSRGFIGVTGKTRFLNWGEAERALRMMRVDGSKFVLTSIMQQVKPKLWVPKPLEKTRSSKAAEALSP